MVFKCVILVHFYNYNRISIGFFLSVFWVVPKKILLVLCKLLWLPWRHMVGSNPSLIWCLVTGFHLTDCRKKAKLMQTVKCFLRLIIKTSKEKS